jgi:hypothetical protein
MTAKAEFDITANDQSAKAAWERQRDLVNAMIGRLGKMEEVQGRMQASQNKAFSQGAAGLAGMAAGAISVQSAFSFITSETQKMRMEADAAAAKYDDLFRKVNVQAGTLGVAGEAGKKRLLGVALQNASTVEESTSIAKALAGSGFSAEQATGDALATVLQAQAAMGQQGEGKGGIIAEATAKYMNALGMDMTGENMRKVLVGMQQSAKAGFGKFEDMAPLSGKVGGFSGKVQSQDVLAAFNIGLLNSASADTAATGLKIFGDRLMGASGDKEREGLLKRAGIKPEQVDLIGESLDDVMATLDTALQKMPETQRTPWMQQMFGTETSGFAGKLIENRGRMDEFRKVMGNEAAFNADVTEMTSGKAAGQRREALREEKRKADADTGFLDKLNVADRLAKEQGGWDIMSPIRRQVAWGASAFMSEDAALAGAFADAGKSSGMLQSDPAGFMRRVNAETASSQASALDQKEMLFALKDIAKNTARPPVVVEKPAVPKRPASAGAGTGGR